MSDLNKNTVARVASLARIAIDEATLEIHTHKLQGILDLFEQLDAVDTGDLEPMAHPIAHQPLPRADVVTEKDQRELLQKNASKVIAGLYLVPKVIEQID
jgi:aspartyl-tRNA(Asn)/glutamyl-tRNA(Gln) amidotransferase subunit C